jgi:hypothetical protein
MKSVQMNNIIDTYDSASPFYRRSYRAQDICEQTMDDLWRATVTEKKGVASSIVRCIVGNSSIHVQPFTRSEYFCFSFTRYPW